MKKWLRGLAPLIVLPLIFSACSNEEGEETIEVAEVTRSIFYAPLYIAIEEGYFADENIDIDLTTTWGGDTTMTALLSDSADVALVGSETSIYVHAQDPSDSVINFGALTETDGTFLVSREPMPDFTWEDLEGSSYLGQRAGGMPQMAGEYVLRQNGIDPYTDVELDQSVDFANIASAFASGSGDFVQLFEPNATEFEEEGIGHIVASFGEESGTLPYTSFITKESMMEENEDALVRFNRAIYKAQQFVENESPEAVAASITPYFDETPEDLIATVVERYRSQGSYAQNPYINEEGWYHLQDIMEESGELPQRIDYEDLVDTTITEQALE
ncbi:NitT/TauT family transport system substrate-binding protein [Geomicrobium halophilum]|uniref:NitT/TauT family transport system substrate-binding protein n=1 Tax=Geomicrobium halophilum TaxID=549000 RepID=A0A841PGZ7_9BACL|nr:ABC transporter substrate-binding protein [Geomicrobium halophilum]MBB6448060.1 NitT/TauT family transport system substrate-binding protein [Geomicrobium halophilum]